MAKSTKAARKSKVVTPHHPTVLVTTRGGPFRDISSLTVQRRATKMLASLQLHEVELSIALVDDSTIQTLNRTYRHQDKPTDVLAFPMNEGQPVRRGMLGDVIVSVETARNQAWSRQRSLLDEITMLLAHGLLHLLGYDHRTDAEEQQMNAKVQALEMAAKARRGNAASMPD